MKQDINSTVNQLFFHLLSAAIWDKEADATLFKGLDDKTWKQIADMAIRQSVSALIADKALSLPQDCLPSRALKLQFLAFVQQTEALNQKMIKVLGNLKDEYDEAGFPFCLLKGLSVGVNYPKPLLRSAGDIDLFLYKEGDFDRVTKLYTSKGYNIESGGRTHNKFTKEDVCIENHNSITYFDNNKYNALFMQWERELAKNENFTIVGIDGLKVNQLPIEMNALYIFYHMFHHFIHEGVGFRQFCDWLLFLSKYKEVFSKDSFTQLATSYALLYPMQIFARAAIKYLDSSEDIFPFLLVHENKHVDMIIEDMLHSGNFGFHRPGYHRPTRRISFLWNSYTENIKRSIKFRSISSEHIKMLPYYMLINYIQKIIKGR